jgi:uncharacterized protein with FMN-binding domain
VKRAPIVVAGTVAGLVAVLEFHTTPAKVSLAGSTLPAATTGGSSRGGSAAGSGQAAGSSTAGTHTVTGPEVNYNWGVLAVKVTVSHGKITKVGLAYLDDGSNPRSQYIDQQSIPLLEQETLQAQSANIQGVSGASYTSAGFTQSLQSALHSLGKS